MLVFSYFLLVGKENKKLLKYLCKNETTVFILFFLDQYEMRGVQVMKVIVFYWFRCCTFIFSTRYYRYSIQFLYELKLNWIWKMMHPIFSRKSYPLQHQFCLLIFGECQIKWPFAVWRFLLIIGLGWLISQRNNIFEKMKMETEKFIS